MVDRTGLAVKRAAAESYFTCTIVVMKGLRQELARAAIGFPRTLSSPTLECTRLGQGASSPLSSTLPVIHRAGRSLLALIGLIVGLVGLTCSCGGGGDLPSAPDGGTDRDPCSPADRVGVCPARGFYQAPVTVTLSAPIGALAIHYSLDGSLPSALSEVYEDPITIMPSPSMGFPILRAVAVYDDGQLSPIETHSYLFPKAVLAQPRLPIGVPAVWGYDGNTRDGDYEMDPRVLADTALKSQATLALRDAATVSLVMPMEQWWTDVSGIYMRPDAVGAAWERAVSVEFFDNGNRNAVQINAGVKIQGNSSTRAWRSAKLSMRLAFRRQYDHGKLEYPLFSGSPVTRFENLILDAHFNHSYTHPDSKQRESTQLARDQFTAQLLLDSGSLSPRSRPVHLYLNGLYWGLYDLHERPDEHFFASFLGGDSRDWDVLRHNGESALSGDTIAWEKLFALARQGLADSQRYLQVAELLDIDEFIDYMLINFYVGNSDWDQHNWYAARPRTGGGGFRFVSWDAERVINDLNTDVTSTWTMGGPTELYRALLASQAFVARLSQRSERLYNRGGVLFVDAAKPNWDPDKPDNNRPAAAYVQLTDSIRPLMLLESARWGDNRRPQKPYGLSEWDIERGRLLDIYFPQRSAIARSQLP